MNSDGNDHRVSKGNNNAPWQKEAGYRIRLQRNTSYVSSCLTNFRNDPLGFLASNGTAHDKSSITGPTTLHFDSYSALSISANNIKIFPSNQRPAILKNNLFDVSVTPKPSSTVATYKNPPTRRKRPLPPVVIPAPTYEESYRDPWPPGAIIAVTVIGLAMLFGVLYCVKYEVDKRNKKSRTKQEDFEMEETCHIDEDSISLSGMLLKPFPSPTNKPRKRAQCKNITEPEEDVNKALMQISTTETLQEAGTRDTEICIAEL